MKKFYNISLLFLLMGGFMGLLLRYQLLYPVKGIVYTYLLHGHSHVMFLGWVFNVLIIAFAEEFAPIKGFKPLFWFLQICVIGMLILFPLQGYGVYSITFSALHTAGAWLFIIVFFTSTKPSTLSVGLAKAALLFFALSTFGPVMLAYLKAHALEHSNLYRFSIYFYLHFQYNGFFVFGILSLLVKLLEGKLSSTEQRSIKRGSYTLIIACLPAFVLSMLWAEPGIVFNILGCVAAVAQLIGLYIILKTISKYLAAQHYPSIQKLLFVLSLTALVAKSILQLISAHPVAAAFANEYRTIAIAYLHLVLVGCISIFLLAWLIHKQVVNYNRWTIGLILAGFIGSEILLVISPWNDLTPNLANQLIFIFSVLMVGGISMLFKDRVAVSLRSGNYIP